jgi:ribosome-binding protein aMBF1 (putative translation factor)
MKQLLLCHFKIFLTSYNSLITDISYMTEKLYPDRLRCKSCRKNLEQIVLNGLYCSYKCAKHPAPTPKIADAPRHCKREVSGVWSHKTKYRYEAAVPQKLRDDPATNIYLCDYCLFLHVGHSRVKPEDQEKLRRVVYDVKTLGSVVQRRREQLNWDKKRLAKEIGTIPIRITEIETSDPKMSVVVLFKVLARLKITVELIER